MHDPAGGQRCEDAEPEIGRRPAEMVGRFPFRDGPRDDARAVIAGLARRGLPVELLSGDRPATVAAMAEPLGSPFGRPAAARPTRLPGSPPWRPPAGTC
jgi:hypothetical protein